MYSSEYTCEKCGHKPEKGFAQMFGETILTCVGAGAVLIVLILLSYTG